MILHIKFGLILTTSWPGETKIIFKIRKISQFAKFAKFRMKTQFISLGKLYQKYNLRNTLITLVILHTEFGLIWATPWPDEKDLFLKFLFRALQKLRNEYQLFF